MKQTKKIALGGVMAALALVILFIGGLLGVGTYAAPMLAAIVLLPSGSLLGRKLHAVLWLAVSALALILVPDVEAALLFFCPIGCWPLMRGLFDRLPRTLRLPAKLLFFLLTTLAMETLLTLLIIPEGLPLWLAVTLLALGCVVFGLYDRMLPAAQHLLLKRLQHILKL